jgi:hypothetical protein
MIGANKQLAAFFTARVMLLHRISLNGM